MSSVIQLLYTWRSPVRRIQEPIAVLHNDHLDAEPDVRLNRRDRRHGRGGEVGDSLQRSHRRASIGRHRKRCSLHAERALGRSSGNGSSSNGFVSNRMPTRLGLTQNDQLPDAVQEARKRLLERLRSVLLTDNRQRAPNDDVFNLESSLGGSFDASYPNTSHEILEEMPDLTSLNGQSSIQTQNYFSLNIKNKKTPAYSWDAFCAMKSETFRSFEDKCQLSECCICLEGFNNGDCLIKLCCSHKFHPDCLKPWVRSSGDCPLCRAIIVY